MSDIDAHLAVERAKQLDPEAFADPFWTATDIRARENVELRLRRVAAIGYALNEQRFPTGLYQPSN